MPRHVLGGSLAILLTGSMGFAEPAYAPARYLSGALPAIPALAVSGGEVFLDVRVAPDGHVDSVQTLRTTPPFTDAVVSAVRGWRFTPATEDTGSSTDHGSAAVAESVLVAAVFAPPTLTGPTLGQPSQDVAASSDGAATAVALTEAGYPPRAMGGGTVLVEVTIDDAGHVADARTVVSSPAFDAAALAAARASSFMPARRSGRAVMTRAYLLFGFRPPIMTMR